MTVAIKPGLSLDASASPTAAPFSLFAPDHAHASDPATITVPDAQLVFGGDYKRAGEDLVLSKDGRDLVLHDYFKGAKHADLATPDGARLNASIVDALTGHAQYAQAGGAAPAAKVIGHVTKLNGSATAIRNGVAIELHVGDNVNQSDVVQAGANSSLGLTFIDGSVFGLGANARMVLNEMVYDPNGSSNSALLSLVQGTVSFLAGETAKHGDMKVDTPVATMGIRGTWVVAELGFEVQLAPNAPPAIFRVLVERDNNNNSRVGDYLLYSKTNPTQVIGRVNSAGIVSFVSGDGTVTQGPAPPLPPEVQNLLANVFEQAFQQQQQNPNPQGGPHPLGSTPPAPPDNSINDFIYQLIPPDTSPGGTGGNTYTKTFNTPTQEFPQETITYTVKVNTPPSISVTPITITIDPGKTNFNIGDQVHISDPDIGVPPFNDVAVPYVPGTAAIGGASGRAPNGVDLKSLITIDENTGKVSYNPGDFAYLKAGEKVVYTITFDSQSGPDTLHESLTVTIDGANDVPVIQAAALSVTQGQPVVLTPSSIVVADPDDTSWTFTVKNVTHGTFQVFDGESWNDATTFTSGDIGAGHVRFVPDGTDNPPTFQITADDGEGQNSLSTTVDGTVNFTHVNQAPQIDADSTTATGSVHELPSHTGDTVDHDSAGGTVAFSDPDASDTHQATPTFVSVVWHKADGTTESIADPGSFALGDVTENGGHGSVGWSYSATDSALDFLGANDTLTITYDVSVDDGHGKAVTQPVTVTVHGANDAPRFLSGIAYMTGTNDPWGIDPSNAGSPDAAMDTAFGAGNWTKIQGFTTAAFAGSYQFVYIDGGDGTSDQFNSFIAENRDALEAFVANGGHLFINAARWTGDDLDVGFGIELHYGNYFSGTGTAVDPLNPIFNGPFGSTGTSWNGDYFSHDIVTGDGITSLIVGQYGTVLAIENWGAGEVLVGGMTSPFFHWPQPESDILLANILANFGNGGAGGASTAASLTEGATACGTETAQGTLAFADVDLTDTHTLSGPSFAGALWHKADGTTVAITDPGHFDLGSLNDSTGTGHGSVGWSYDVSDASVGYLAAGETITITYNVTVTDGSGAHATAPVTITIHGTDEAPVVTGPVEETVAEDAPASTLDALANASDPDQTDVLSVVNVPDALPPGVTYNAATHSFTLDPSNDAYQYLGVNDQTTVTVAYDVFDGTKTTPASVSWTVTGTNDAPVVALGTVNSGTIAVPSQGDAPLTDEAAALLTAGHNLVNGMGGSSGFGTGALATGDDNSSGAIDITAVFGDDGVNFFGHQYTSIYINNNGNITFAGPSDTYTPTEINAGFGNPIIAPFWADVDTRLRTGASGITSPGGTSDGADKVFYNLDPVNGVLTVTWDDVGYYNQHNTPDAFQVQLISTGDGNFDIVYRYENINWTTGDVSDGLAARVGYSSGDGTNYYELPQSGDAAALQALPTTEGNTGIPGVYVFEVRNGVVGPSMLSVSGTIAFSDRDLTDRPLVSTEFTSFTLKDADGNDITATLSAAQLAAIAAVETPLILTQSHNSNDGSAGWTYKAPTAALVFLGAGQTLALTYTATIDDGHGGVTTTPVTVTITGPDVDPAALPIQVNVQTADGYDTTTLWADLKNADLVSVDSHHIVLSDGARTITIDGTGIVTDPPNADPTQNDIALVGGTISAIHVSDATGALLDITNLNIAAADLYHAVGPGGTQPAFDDLFAGRTFSVHGGAGADTLFGGNGNDLIDTGGGADSVQAGGGNDVIIVHDNADWQIDGGAGINTLRLAGAFDIGQGNHAQVDNIQILDLNTTDPDSVKLDPQGVANVNGAHTLRVLGNAGDLLNLGNDFPGHSDGHWVETPNASYQGDALTSGVQFDKFEYQDGAATLATLYVEHGVTVNQAPVISTADMAESDNFVTGLSISDANPNDLVRVMVSALNGTVTQANGDPLPGGLHTIAAVNDLLSQGVLYTPIGSPTGDQVTMTVTDAHGASDEVNFIFNLAAPAGNQVSLTGTDGKDVIFDTGHDDTLTGGAGKDQFIFAHLSGNDTVTDFSAGEDKLDLRADAALTTDNFAAWFADNIEQTGTDTTIHIGAETILLQGVQKTALTPNDFILHPGGGFA